MKKLDLIIFNYRMDENDLVFSHQLQVVNALAGNFQNVIVVTGKTGEFSVPNNVKVFSSNWQEGRNLRNALNFLHVSVPIILGNRGAVLFSHMTERFSILVLPLTKLLRIRHVLWYAHANKNPLLRIIYLGVNIVLTSTNGSFPFRGRKITCIGQGVSTKDFQPCSQSMSLKFQRLIHVGRLDKSKNILGIIDFSNKLRKSTPDLKLTIVGRHINLGDKVYVSALQALLLSNKKWIRYIPGSPRSEIPELLSQSDLFVHMFKGSLDKTLIEATLSGIPVITLNSEYINVFGTWSTSHGAELNLEDEYASLRQLDLDDLILELSRRLKIAQDFHGFDRWCEKVTDILYQS
jgi:glycosyltransferase involved in cell wall biosynthesis